MQTDILIIGGGLSGLSLAERLHEAGSNFILAEARDRFGGRILTETSGTAYFDMGPAWFWPNQPQIAALIERLGLEKFDQAFDGDLIHEGENGRVQRGRGYASMQGSYRLKGGLQALTDALAHRLPDQRKLPGSAIHTLTKKADGIVATLESGKTISANQVVLAIPPRVVVNSIHFEPALPPQSLQAMQSIPTWMAGQAKVVVTYDAPFWRTAGLSGDAMSRHGPMVEIHDASPFAGGPYALFGFIGIPPHARADASQLRTHVLAQFTRLFGPRAANPDAYFDKDWASDPHTATALDQTPPYAHPQYGLPADLRDLWDDRLHLAGTEVAPQFGGFLEGALEAAENALDKLQL